MSKVIAYPVLVERGLDAMLNTSLGPVDAARAVLIDCWTALDRDTQRDLAIMGLAHVLGARYANRRFLPAGPTESESKAIVVATGRMARTIGKAVADHAVTVLESIALFTRGKMRPLSDFTRADLESWTRKCRSRSAAWKIRAEWCAFAARAMTESAAKTLGTLPTAMRNDLAKSAEQIWSRATRSEAKRREAKRSGAKRRAA